MPVATRRELLEAGVHFGHQTRRWNPKMRRYIFGERSGIYIIDLEKTLFALNETYEFLMEIGRRGGTVLLVGTKKQAQETVAEQATRVAMPYVNMRWLGGMLTNFQTIHGRLRRLKELREMERSGAFEFLPKKEVLKLRHEKEKLERNLSGIQDMERIPDAVYVIDTKREQIAVREARKLGIPVVAIVDTNCDPDEVDYVIPGNDDAIRACSLITKVVADAIQEGQYLAYRSMQPQPDEAEFEPEPTAAAAPAPSATEDRRPVQLSEEEAAFFGATLEEAPEGGPEEVVGSALSSVGPTPESGAADQAEGGTEVTSETTREEVDQSISPARSPADPAAGEAGAEPPSTAVSPADEPDSTEPVSSQRPPTSSADGESTPAEGAVDEPEPSA